MGAWLDHLCLTEYKDIFIGHDVRGAELIHLERRDLKVGGVLPGCCGVHPLTLACCSRTWA